MAGATYLDFEEGLSDGVGHATAWLTAEHIELAIAEILLRDQGLNEDDLSSQSDGSRSSADTSVGSDGSASAASTPSSSLCMAPDDAPDLPWRLFRDPVTHCIWLVSETSPDQWAWLYQDDISYWFDIGGSLFRICKHCFERDGHYPLTIARTNPVIDSSSAAICFDEPAVD